MKAFYAYELVKEIDDISFQTVEEPKGLQWKTIGFKNSDLLGEDELEDFYETKNFKVLDVAIVERILPSAAIKRAVREKCLKHARETGEPITKGIIAEFTETYLQEALPNAPLKETIIRCAIGKDKLFIGTSSAKVADSIIAFFAKAIESFHAIALRKDFSGFLTNIVKTDALHIDYDLGATCKLVSGNERKLAVSNDEGLPLISDVVGEDDRATVAELQFFGDDGNFAFTLTEKGLVKGIKTLVKLDKRAQIDERRQHWAYFEPYLIELWGFLNVAN